MYVSSITGHFPYLGLFILLILGGIGFPFPEGVTLILCGLLISTKVIQPVYALVIVYSGSPNRRLPLLFLWKEVWPYDYQARSIS